MTTAREVWLALIQNHQKVYTTPPSKDHGPRERCAAASLEQRGARPHATNQTSLAGPKASAVAGRKRRKMNEDAGRGRIIKRGRLRRRLRGDTPARQYLPPARGTQYSRRRRRLGQGATGQPVLIKAGEMQEKVIFGLDSKFHWGLNKDQDPIGEIVRDTAETRC